MKKTPEAVVKDYLKEIEFKKQTSFNEDALLSELFPKQKEFVLSKSLFKVYYGGRGAGKTSAVLIDILIKVHKVFPEKKGYMLIASYDIDKSKSLYHELIEEALDKMSIVYYLDRPKHRIHIGNTIVQFIGLKDKPSADKGIGLATKFVVIEEPHTIPAKWLEYFIDTVTKQRLHEFHPYGQIAVVGNPPRYYNKYLESLYLNKEIHVIKTTMYDNQSYSKEAIRYQHEEDAKRMGFTYEQYMRLPETRRSVFGDMVYDANTIIFNPTQKNVYKELPIVPYERQSVIGIDLGYRSSNAILSCMFSDYDEKIWVDFEDAVSEEGPSDLGQRFKGVELMYDPVISVCDPGGSGRGIVEDLAVKYSMKGVLPAEKQNKEFYIKQVADEINKGNLMFKEDSQLMDEMKQIIWDKKCKDFDKIEGLNSDLADALVYSIRHINNHLRFAHRKKEHKTEEEKIIENAFNPPSANTKVAVRRDHYRARRAVRHIRRSARY